VIEILSTPPLNTVQDLGRFGSRHCGVSTCGVMDPVAFVVGNVLLGNPDNAACVEVQTFPFIVRFLADTNFAVTGAATAATLDEHALPSWWSATARRGQTLTLRPPGSGARAYLTLAGGIDVPVILGSRSTHLRSEFGGFCGRSLQQRDVLRTLDGETGVAPWKSGGLGVVPPAFALPPRSTKAIDRILRVRVLRAGEYDLFSADMQEKFWTTDWKITHQSDRGGYRLSGHALKLATPVEMRSYGLVAGIVQVPPSGEPIIQLSDANTAGGYPKIAAVIEADVWRLGQARLGTFVRFKEVTYEAAVEAMVPVTAYITRIRRTTDLYRSL
jgi:5-oxoprolinase (ATP-hydrolysing) subunit C